MEQDPAKINAIIAQLKKDTGDEWDETVGFFAVMLTKYNGTVPEFNLSSGMVQKAFINLKTGEVRYFWIDRIKKQNEQTN
jgi:hypothetical protein